MASRTKLELILITSILVLFSGAPVSGGTALSTCYNAVLKECPWDTIMSVAETVDGGYIFSGSNVSSETGRKEMTLVRTSGGGLILWRSRYSCPGSCEADSVIQTTDGGYAVTGGTMMPAGNTGVVLLKTDNVGKEVWRHTFRPPGNQYGRVVRQYSSGGYGLLSSMSSVPLGMPGTGVPAGPGLCLSTFYRTDKNGKEIWNRSFGGSGESCLVTMELSADGGVMLGGSTSVKGAGGLDMYLVKIDNVGNVIWDKTFGGPGNETGKVLTPTKDHNIIFAGVVHDPVANTSTPLVAKIDPSGNVVWSKTFSSVTDPDLQALITTLDNGIVVSEPPSEAVSPITADTAAPAETTVFPTPPANKTVSETTIAMTISPATTEVPAAQQTVPPTKNVVTTTRTAPSGLPLPPVIVTAALVGGGLLLTRSRRRE